MIEKINQEVYYYRGDLPIIDSSIINFVTRQAYLNPRKRCRICFHHSPEEDLHEMLIAHSREVFVPPHAHLDRAESLILISGLVSVFILDENGTPLKRIKLGSHKNGNAFSVHIPIAQWHTQRFESEMVVFYEVTKGPFNPLNTIYLWDFNSPNYILNKTIFLNKLDIACS